MRGKTNILVTKECREHYGSKVEVGAEAISQNNDEFVGAVPEFDAARAEDSAARACSQRADNLTGNAMGMVDEQKEDKIEESAARKRYQPERNRVDQSMEEVNNIFRGGN